MLLFAACFFVVATAHAAVMVRKASELDSDDYVQWATSRYRIMSSAYVIYDQCSKTLPTLSDDAPYVKEQLVNAEVKLREAYHNAYVKRVGYPPDMPMVQDYVTRIRKAQQVAVNNTALAIRKDGCYDFSVKNIIDFVTKLRHPAPTTEEE
ncbi:MAG: hypothetical protein ACKVOE_00830 [Rickettsiales bacterium]